MCGVYLIRYTRAAISAIHSSTKIDDTISYLSMHDNKYIRYFQGHMNKFVKLCVSDDILLSGFLDEALRL